MNNYIKLHYDIIGLDLPLEERVVLALIRQMTENGQGSWAGYKAMADLLKIHKSDCKKAVEHLREIGLITISSERINRKTRIVFRTKFSQ